jgi:HEAT repeat protein
LKSKSASKRHRALLIIRDGEKLPENQLDPILDSINDRNDVLARLAFDVVARSSPSYQFILGLQKDKRVPIRQAAAVLFGNCGEAPEKIVASLLDSLKDESEKVQIKAVRTIGSLGKVGQIAAPDIVTSLKSGTSELRKESIVALGKIKSKKGVQALEEALNDQDSQIPPLAARALGEIGVGANSSVPNLLLALEGKDIALRAEAGLALGKTYRKNPEIIPALLESFRQENNRRIRAELAYGLGVIGHDAKSAVPTLIAALNDKENTDAWEQARLQRCIAWSLGQMGRAARDAVPSLLLLAKTEDTDTALRLAIIDCLGDIGSGTKEVIALLKDLTRRQDTIYVESARRALNKLDSDQE